MSGQVDSRPMHKIELQFRCRKCKSSYPATVSFAGMPEDIDPDDNQTRCPYCGEWNCADATEVRRAAKGLSGA